MTVAESLVSGEDNWHWTRRPDERRINLMRAHTRWPHKFIQVLHLTEAFSRRSSCLALDAKPTTQ